jgi:hypothetical protein
VKPARKIVQRSPYRDVGAVHAAYLQPDPIEWESPWEKAFIHLALPCPVVAHIQFQPFTLTYVDSAGKERKHTPDFLIRLNGGSRLVVEVKTTKFVAQHQEKFDKSTALLWASGARYYVITEKQLDLDRCDRANVWRRYARLAAPADQVAIVLGMVRDSQAGRTVQALLNAGVATETLYHLLGRRVLFAAQDLQTTPTTTLTLSQQGPDDERLQFDHWFDCSAWGTDVRAAS